jgi:ankyrin repeat protein
MAIQKVTAVFNLNQMLATDDVEALIAELDNPRSKLNPYKRDTNGYSLAMTAAKSGAFSIVKYLVEVYKLGLKSSTTNALVLATETDNLKLFKYLTRHLRIGDTDDSGYNAWERALINNAEKC